MSWFRDDKPRPSVKLPDGGWLMTMEQYEAMKPVLEELRALQARVTLLEVRGILERRVSCDASET